MWRRKYHQKARTGCIQCKGRRLKCDEEHPICARCDQKGERCSYLDSTLVIISSFTGSKARTTKERIPKPDSRQTTTTIEPTSVETKRYNHQKSSRTTVPIQIQRQIAHRQQTINSRDIYFSSPATLQDDNNYDSRLLHYFTHSTSTTMADESYTPIWQHTIPTLSLTHPFLLSGLLAITSLHLSITTPSTTHSKQTLKHHTQALALFRQELQTITPENATALFSFAVLIPNFAFGVRNTRLRKGNDVVGDLCDIFALMRGIGVVVRGGGMWLDGCMSAAKSSPVPSLGGGISLPVSIERSLSLLSSRNQELYAEKDEEGYAIYKQAIGLVVQSFLLAKESPRTRMNLLPFAIFGPEKFVGRLRAGEELALAIVAHHAVLMYWLRDNVWLWNWGEDIILEARRRLGSEWEECLAWPLAEVERGNVALSLE
ncbi:hypothetical protein HYFRA_00010428 [Hymenoscyphus fraxineus]|uniref:Zn(2)-C6 fungal-type domain-containing protein n=1 Tax=Hymenoscyphus fraxineus TaxID=746836 RepID=A0A9N9PXE4_9HELO|nr:hypothetical protein HYFRA_00010428 [Hymenoscyphus fraxineus]